MTRFILSPLAQSDLDEIWDHTVKNWGMEQAELYVRQLETAIKSVAEAPGLGRPCDDIRTGYRKYPAGSHVVFFKVTDAAIEVIRILHRNMDFDRHLY